MSNVTRSIISTSSLLLMLLLAPASVHAAATDLDPDWGTAGTVEVTTPAFMHQLRDVAVDSEGRVVSVGDVISGSTKTYVERRLPNGTLDTSFDTDGYAMFDLHLDEFERGWTVTVDSQDRIYVGAAARVDGVGFNNDIIVMRITEAGALDTTFGDGGDGFTMLDTTVDSRLDVLEYVHDIELDTQGRVVVTGQGRGGDPTRTEDVLVARLTAAGLPDTTFPGGTGVVITSIIASTYGERASAVEVLDGDALVVGGETSYSPVPGLPPKSGVIVKYTAAGALDTAFDTDGKLVFNEGGGVPGATVDHEDWSAVFDVEPTDGGKLLVAGSVGVDDTADVFVGRLTSTGAWDTTFGSGGATIIDVGGFQDELEDMEVLGDGSIILAGRAADDAQLSSPRYLLALARVGATGTPDSTFGTGGAFTTSVADLDEVYEALVVQADGKLLAAGQAQGTVGGMRGLIHRYDADQIPLPVMLTAPAVGGSTEVGRQLTCGLGTWSGSPTLVRMWLRNGVVVSGSGASRTVAYGDVGANFACRVAATNAAGTVTRTSAARSIPRTRAQLQSAVARISRVRCTGHRAADGYCYRLRVTGRLAIAATGGGLYGAGVTVRRVTAAGRLGVVGRTTSGAGGAISFGRWVVPPRGVAIQTWLAAQYRQVDLAIGGTTRTLPTTPRFLVRR